MGNSVEIVQYDEVQFSKTDAVRRGTGLANLGKTEDARAELRELERAHHGAEARLRRAQQERESLNRD